MVVFASLDDKIRGLTQRSAGDEHSDTQNDTDYICLGV